MIQTWCLHTSSQSLVLASKDQKLPQVIYWGSSLPMEAIIQYKTLDDLITLTEAHHIDVTGGMLDQPAETTICPLEIRSFPGQVGLSLRDATGQIIQADFLYEDSLQDKNSLQLIYKDVANDLTYRATFKAYETTGMIACQSFLEAEDHVNLEWLSAPAMPAPQNGISFMDFAGRWCGEFQEQMITWRVGAHIRDNRTGRTGHESFPAVFLPTNGNVSSISNTEGQVYGLHYAWSGGHRMVAEELSDGQRQIQFGHAPNSERSAGKSFASAPLYICHSSEGLNGCAKIFQRHLRQHIVKAPHSNKSRPVHYNCWEAIYFDHDVAELKQLATKAAALGAERFVLDDGWFGKRDDDTQSLADWQIDPRKYPEGLKPLIDHIHKEGMTFGIWFEPEMINENSETYQAHPDWVLGNGDQIRGRQQLVLDMTKPAVQDYLYDCIAKVLSENAVDYIKWDHNRVLPYADAAQARATYALMSRLRKNFPDVEIESCASGGGRIDFGILEHTQRVWLSDSNDAIERARIQHNAALFLPMTVTGSHVGPRKCHTSGRVFDMSFRAWIAAQRHMGIEMDPNELDEAETETLTQVINWWKANRDWLVQADILRLDHIDPAILSEIHVSEEGDRFVSFVNKIDTSRQINPRPIRLSGLQADQLYKIKLGNQEERVALSRGENLVASKEVILSGAYLMQQGITLPWSFPCQVWVIEGQAVTSKSRAN